jgi:L-threonylcarbamoyladenylate synthase
MTLSLPLRIPLEKAARILRQGGVVAYPTEGVFGLGCLPDDEAAAERIFAIKQRDPAKGLILIAAHPSQLEPYATLPATGFDAGSGGDRPITWVVPPKRSTPAWIRGRHPGIAVRISSHPVAAALCHAAGSALVSTSANLSGQPPARNRIVLRRIFGPLVDYIVPGDCGSSRGPSEIRDFASGRILRPAR